MAIGTIIQEDLKEDDAVGREGKKQTGCKTKRQGMRGCVVGGRGSRGKMRAKRKKRQKTETLRSKATY